MSNAPATLDFPAVDGRPVTEAHAAHCYVYGHATRRVNGIVQGDCPRCGEEWIGEVDLATARVFDHFAGEHTSRCCWHNVMAYAENWADSQYEDPTAEWCQGEPIVEYLVENASAEILNCNCD